MKPLNHMQLFLMIPRNFPIAVLYHAVLRFQPALLALRMMITLIDAFAKLWKVTISFVMYVCRYGCLSVYLSVSVRQCEWKNNSAHTWRKFMKLYITAFLRKSVEKTRSFVNLLKPTGYGLHQQFEYFNNCTVCPHCIYVLRKQRLVPLTASTDWFL
jgi:hypothetical protein